MHEDDAIPVKLIYVMHEPKASALWNRDQYCIVRVDTLKHAKPAKCVLSVLLQSGDLSANQMCGIQMTLLTRLVRTSVQSWSELRAKLERALSVAGPALLKSQKCCVQVHIKGEQ